METINEIQKKINRFKAPWKVADESNLKEGGEKGDHSSKRSKSKDSKKIPKVPSSGD